MPPLTSNSSFCGLPTWTQQQPSPAAPRRPTAETRWRQPLSWTEQPAESLTLQDKACRCWTIRSLLCESIQSIPFECIHTLLVGSLERTFSNAFSNLKKFKKYGFWNHSGLCVGVFFMWCCGWTQGLARRAFYYWVPVQFSANFKNDLFFSLWRLSQNYYITSPFSLSKPSHTPFLDIWDSLLLFH